MAERLDNISMFFACFCLKVLNGRWQEEERRDTGAKIEEILWREATVTGKKEEARKSLKLLISLEKI